MRFLIAHLISGNTRFGSLESLVPDIYVNSGYTLSRMGSPRYLKSHEPFMPNYPRVVYIVRDPRDVAISYFHHVKKFRVFPNDLCISSFVELFVEGKIDSFGNWAQNVGSWLGALEGDSKFLLVKYEDLKLEPINTLTAVADHIGLSVDAGAIEKSVSASSFSQLQKLEAEEGEDWKSLANTRSDISFVRKGEVGGWVNQLALEDVERIERKFARLMGRLGYVGQPYNQTTQN